jgi:DNA-binding response OmpR family regulator
VDLGRRTVTADGRPVDLTFTEFEILAALVSRAGAAVSREELIQLVWADGAPDGAAAKGLNVHVHRLRRKLGEEFSHRLRTLRGFGYRYDDA